MRVFMRRHFCRADPWPEALSFEGFGEDVYRTLWGPSEFTPRGSLAGWDVSARLGDVDVPALIVSGAHDEMAPALQEELEAGLPRARRVVFRESAHMAHLEEPERIADAVEAFLDALDGS